MTKDEREQLVRRYAADEISWHELRERGFDDYVEVLGPLGELRLRPPMARMQGPNDEVRQRGSGNATRRIAVSLVSVLRLR